MGLPTIREIWRLALPTTAELLNRNGNLDHPVAWVHRVESCSPAFVDLGNDEVVLLSAETIQLLDGRLTLAQVIALLVERQVASIVLVGAITQEAQVVADDHEVCIFSLPGDVDLHVVEKDIIRLIVKREAQLDRLGRQVYRQLAQFSIENYGLRTIAEALFQIAGKSVVIQDDQLAIHAVALTQDCPFSTTELEDILSDTAVLHKWLARQKLDSKAPPCIRLGLETDNNWARFVAAIVIEGRIGGYLSILGELDNLDELDNLAAERGALVCAVELAKQRAVEAAEQRQHGDFLDMLLTTGSTEQRAVARQAAEIGYELDREHVVVLFGMAGNSSRTRALMASEFRARFLNTGVQLFLCSYEQDLAALCGAEDPELLKNVEQHVRITHALVLRENPDAHISVSVGRPGTGLAGLRASFAQALEALTLTRDILGGDRMLPADTLRLYHLLCRLQDSDEMIQFYKQTLAPLVAYDADHDAQLVHTLEVFFAHHGNVSQTAESLFLHRNSLLYRLERISEISGLDLNNPDNRFSLQLALKLYPLLPSSMTTKGSDDA